MMKLILNRFDGESDIQYSQSPRIEINSDLKIKGTNRDLKAIDTAITDINNKLNETVYCCVIMEDTLQNFPASTYALVNLGTVQVDTHNGFNTQAHSYTIPISGYYIIALQTEFDFEGTRRIVSRLHVNGTAIRYGITGGVGFSGAAPITEIRYLNQGDIITVYGKVDGVDATIKASNYSTYLQIKKL